MKHLNKFIEVVGRDFARKSKAVERFIKANANTKASKRAANTKEEKGK